MRFSLRGTCAKHGGKCTLLLYIVFVVGSPGYENPVAAMVKPGWAPGGPAGYETSVAPPPPSNTATQQHNNKATQQHSNTATPQRNRNTRPDDLAHGVLVHPKAQRRSLKDIWEPVHPRLPGWGVTSTGGVWGNSGGHYIGRPRCAPHEPHEWSNILPTYCRLNKS